MSSSWFPGRLLRLLSGPKISFASKEAGIVVFFPLESPKLSLTSLVDWESLLLELIVLERTLSPTIS